MQSNPILIVEDDEPVREMFAEAFMKKGYEVHTAESAEKALQILDAQSIPVMFVDLKLPGMDGMEFCKEIRKTDNTAIIYAITGYSSIFEHAACLTAGFNDYFKKPIGVEVLFRAAEDAFNALAAKTRP